MTTRSTRLRSIIGGSAGNLVEWYDWYVYTAFALYFAPVFFPAGDRTTQLLNTAAMISEPAHIRLTESVSPALRPCRSA